MFTIAGDKRCPRSSTLGSPMTIKNFLFGFATQLFDFPACKLGRRRIDKGRAALEVQPVNAFAGRVENVLITALQLLQFLSPCLHVQFEDVFGAPKFLRLLSESFFGLLA